MDDVNRHWYESRLQLEYWKCKRDAFQDFFATVMEKGHPDDFIRVRAWGKVGDRKNDGYLTSTKTIFQCYAPNDMDASTAIKKINADFIGAKKQWKHRMLGWTFVHNSPFGLGPDVLQRLLDLGTQHAPVRVTSWGFAEIRLVVFRLGDADLESLLGPPLKASSFQQLGFDDLSEVLEAIRTEPYAADVDVRPVPAGKLSHNRLSTHIAWLLRRGMAKADLVRSYFDKHPDATRGDRVAQALKTQYQVLRGQGLEPDNVFQGLQAFVGGGVRGTPAHEAAVFAVLAYLFEQCEIFENPTVVS